MFIALELLWLLILIFFEFYILIYSLFVCYQYLQLTKITLYTGLDIFILTTFRVLCIIITLESFMKRKIHTKILNSLRKVDNIFTNQLNERIDYALLGRLIIVMFVKWFSIYIFTDTFLIWLTLSEGANSISIFILLFVYPLFKLTLNGSKFMIFAHLIKFRIDAMHRALSNCNQTDENAHLSFNNIQYVAPINRYHLNHMQHLWHIYNRIYDIVQLVNNGFVWSFSINFSIEILAVCAVLYRVLDHILGPPNRFPITTIIPFIVYLCYYLFRVVMLIRIAHNVASDVDNFANRIQTLELPVTEFNEFVSVFKLVQPHILLFK